MAAKALDFKMQELPNPEDQIGQGWKADLQRIQMIRNAVGSSLRLRIDANQGWDFETARTILIQMGMYDIEFCRQPLRSWNDDYMPALRKISPIKIMADESVFNHHDARRLILAGALRLMANIKFSKSGGIAEAIRINQVCESHGIACMMGGMLESRLALTAFAHFSLSTKKH